MRHQTALSDDTENPTPLAAQFGARRLDGTLGKSPERPIARVFVTSGRPLLRHCHARLASRGARTPGAIRRRVLKQVHTGGLIATLRVNGKRLRELAPAGFTLATDLAEYLVQRGVPFREAHEIVGHLVVWCQVNDVALDEVSDEDLAKVSPHLTPDVRAVLTVEGALAARKGFGGTAPDRVAEQLVALRAAVDDGAAWAAAGGA